jgi:hypothetical protein
MDSEAHLQFLDGERVVTKAPPWHAAVSLDMFFSSVAAGTFIVAEILLLVSPFRWGIVALFGFFVAFPVEIADLICLVIDLGHPARFHHMLRMLKLRSPMSLGVWLSSGLAVFAFFEAVIAMLVVTGNFMMLTPLRWIGLAGLPFALGVAMYKGVLLSTTTQPVWGRMRWLGAILSASSGACGLTVMMALAAGLGDDSGALALRFAAGVVLALYTLALAIAMGPVNHALSPRIGKAKLIFWNALAVYVGGALAAALALAPKFFPQQEFFILAITLIGALSLRHILILIPHRVSAA